MKHLAFCCASGVAAAILSSTLATAATDTKTAAPSARRGFQLALRTGYSTPLGNAMKDSPMSDWFTGQVPFVIDVGGKPWEHLFFGGFLGLSGGGAGDALVDCTGCSSIGVRFGAEALYSFLPGGRVDPWLGYGIGFAYVDVGDDSGTVDLSGFEPAILSGGVDFRLSRVFGLGPFVELSLGRYSTIGAESGDFGVTNDLDERATHAWLTLGVRGVFFP